MTTALATINSISSMTTLEIAELTSKRHDHVMRDTRNMLTELYGENSLPKFGESYRAENGQEYLCYRLPKNEILTLVSGYSIPLRHKIITRLDELENNTSLKSLPSEKKEFFELQMLGLKYCSEMLHYSDVSKLQLIHAAHEYYGVPTAILPVYVKDVRVTFSAKDLLEKNSLSLSPVAFNKLLMANGLLEEKERSSSKGDGTKKFKALTDEGLKYGQNDSSKHNPRETQPHYYEDTFMELYNLINK